MNADVERCPHCGSWNCQCKPLSTAIRIDYQQVRCSECGVTGPVAEGAVAAIGNWNAMPRVQPGYATLGVVASLIQMTEFLDDHTRIEILPEVKGKRLTVGQIRKFAKEMIPK